MNKKELTPFLATHPGEMIKDELKERGMTQKQLATETGIKPSVLSETINGKRSVSLHVAVALEKALGIPAEVWMNLQTQYDLDTAKIADRDDQRETIAVTIPVRDRNLLRELVRKFGWVCVLWEQNKLTVIADRLRTFDAHKPSVLPAETTNLRKSIRRNEETIPLILLNDSNGIVTFICQIKRKKLPNKLRKTAE